MAYKTGFILSLVFLVQLFVLLGDIVSIQMIYTNLDAVSVTAGYLISKSGKITNEVIQLVMDEAGATIEATGDEAPMLGSLYTYRIAREYDPLIIQQDIMTISVERSIVIGYFNQVGKEEKYVGNQRPTFRNYFDYLNFWDCPSCYDCSIQNNF